MRFRNAFVTTPLCSPSRASFLTGQYAHKHGITDNTDRSPRSHELVTFPRLLHDAGYETAFIGKWHMGLDDSAAARHSITGSASRARAATSIPSSTWTASARRSQATSPTSSTGFALDFVKQKHAKPYLLYLSHKAVHPDLVQNADGSVSDPTRRQVHSRRATQAALRRGHDPASRQLRQSAGGQACPAPTDRRSCRRSARQPARTTKRFAIACACSRRWTRASGRSSRRSKSKGQLDNTLIVFTSDDGYFYGEHGLSVERQAGLRGVDPHSALDALAEAHQGRRRDRRDRRSSIDLAPTLLEIGGAPAAKDMHGRSLVPLLRGEQAPWRDSFLIEYFSDKVFPRMSKMGYQCVRTERWKYIHYVDLEGMDELYDLRSDPFEMTNVIDEPDAQTCARERRQGGAETAAGGERVNLRISRAR